MSRVALLLAVLVLAGCVEPEPAPRLATGQSEAEIALVLRRGQQALEAAGIEELTWGLVPYLDKDTLEARYGPILNKVAADLGVPIRIVVGEDYLDMEQQVIRGQVDLANLPPYSYIRAKAAQPGLQLFASHVSGGSPTYACYVIVRDDDPARTLPDLVGRTFGFVDRSSASGWLVPAARLLDVGVHPLLGVRATFLGAHERVFEALVDGRIDAGATYAGALAEARIRRPDAPRVRVIAKGERMPHDAYLARSGFPAEATRAIGQALTEISTRNPEGRRILAKISRLNGFLLVDDSHYDVVREVEARVIQAVSDRRSTTGQDPPSP